MENKCEDCGKDTERRNEFRLCDACAGIKGYVWSWDREEFVEESPECFDCDGVMHWCSSCQVHSQDCCVDYGTCQCS